ncbi:MAG: hypothetical protein QXO15_06290 [Nitrososphaerota archaeon]
MFDVLIALAMFVLMLVVAGSGKEKSDKSFNEKITSSKLDLKFFDREEPEELQFGMNWKKFCDPLPKPLPPFPSGYKLTYLPDPGSMSLKPTWAKVDPVTGRTKEILTVENNHYVWKSVDRY